MKTFLKTTTSRSNGLEPIGPDVVLNHQDYGLGVIISIQLTDGYGNSETLFAVDIRFDCEYRKTGTYEDGEPILEIEDESRRICGIRVLEACEPQAMVVADDSISAVVDVGGYGPRRMATFTVEVKEPTVYAVRLEDLGPDE